MTTTAWVLLAALIVMALIALCLGIGWLFQKDETQIQKTEAEYWRDNSRYRARVIRLFCCIIEDLQAKGASAQLFQNQSKSSEYTHIGAKFSFPSGLVIILQAFGDGDSNDFYLRTSIRFNRSLLDPELLPLSLESQITKLVKQRFSRYTDDFRAMISLADLREDEEVMYTDQLA